ncbi:MAG: ParB/RepB/Spo0J family partition protein [Acidimicrobiales bacterium]
MVRRSGLGRGLGALIPAEASDVSASDLRELAVGSIRPNPRQPRQRFDEEALSSLVASVRELGVLQPILVRPAGDDSYEIVAGERRWRAAKRAGLSTISAIIREADDIASLEQAVVENLHREDLNPLEEAAAYQQLIEDFDFSHEQLARRVGKSRAAVTNTLRLFQLPPSIQRQVAEGHLSAGHARALLATPDREFQEALSRRAVKEGLSVRAVEELVRAHAEPERAASDAPARNGSGAPATPSPAMPSPPKLRHPGMHELEQLLSEHLATTVRVEEGGKRARIVVEFADLADLERIYRAMTEPSTVGASE